MGSADSAAVDRPSIMTAIRTGRPPFIAISFPFYNGFVSTGWLAGQGLPPGLSERNPYPTESRHRRGDAVGSRVARIRRLGQEHRRRRRERAEGVVPCVRYVIDR